MSKIKLFIIYTFLTSLFPLFACASNGQLSVTFANQTDGDVEFIPMINGETEFKTKYIIPKIDHSADASIVISKMTKQSVIYLKKNNEVIARIVFIPIKDNKQTVRIKVFASDSPIQQNSVDTPKYQVKPILLSFHPDCHDNEPCELWSQSPSGSYSSLHISIDQLK
jgi:hypothetical protein